MKQKRNILIIAACLTVLIVGVIAGRYYAAKDTGYPVRVLNFNDLEDVNLNWQGTEPQDVFGATVLFPYQGGTGLASYSVGELLYASGPGTLSRLLASGSEGNVLTFSSGLPAWAAATGGTGSAIPHSILDSDWHSDALLASVSAGSLIIGNATPKWSELTIGASQSFLMSDGTTAFWADYVDANTTYTAGDMLTLTGTDFDIDDPFTVVTLTGTHVSASEDFTTPSGQITSLSATTLNFPDDSIAEADISFSTACAAGSHYYLNGTNLACETDDDTTYTGGDHLTLTGTDFDVDDDFLLNNGDTGTWVSLSADFQAAQANIASISGTNLWGFSLTDCDADNQTIAWSDTGVFSCGDDDTGGAGGEVHGLLNTDWHTDVVLASASVGSLIVGEGDSWKELVNGASNSFLISDGSSVSWNDTSNYLGLNHASVSDDLQIGNITQAEVYALIDYTPQVIISNEPEFDNTYPMGLFASTSGVAIYGKSDEDNGIFGINNEGASGVYGGSTTGYGVYGESTTSHGVYGKSVSGYAIYADGRFYANYATISNDFETNYGQITSLSATTLNFPDDSIAEADISFSTACAAGSHYYLSGTNLACETDDNTTYTATDPLFLTGTAFDIDYASQTFGGYLLGSDYETLWGHQASVNAHIDWTHSSSSFESDSTASISGAVYLFNTPNCDTIDTDSTGLLKCGTDNAATGTPVSHGLLSDWGHNDVSNASASAGALIYGAGTTWTPLAVGASDSFLQSDGTNPVWADYVDKDTTYTGGDHLTLTGTDFDVDDDFLLNNGDTGTWVSISAGFEADTGVIASLSATTLNFPNDSVAEEDIDMNTACTSTQKLYVNGNDFACNADDDVPEIADFSALVGGEGIDNNSGTLDLDLTEFNNPTFASGSATQTWTIDLATTDVLLEFGSDIIRTSASWSIDDATSISGQTSLGVASVSGAFYVDSTINFTNLKSCDTIDSDVNGLLSCGTDATAAGGLATHGLLSDFGHNDVSNASASAGALIYGSGTTWTPLAVGASNSFLISDATNPIYLIDPTVASMSITNLWTSTLTGTLTGDLTCTDCLNATEIEDIYFLTAGDNASASTLTIDSADITSASFGTINLPDDSIQEADISFTTACAAGNHYYLNGNDLACEADDDTTYTGGDNLTLNGTDFDVDDPFAVVHASASEDFSTPSGQITSLSFSTIFGGGLVDCDGDTQTLGWSDTGVFTCGDDDNTGGAGGEVHGLLNTDWHTDVLLASVSQGSLIVGNSTPKWAELVMGASGSFAGANGVDTLFVNETGNIDIYGTASISSTLWVGGASTFVGAITEAGIAVLNNDEMDASSELLAIFDDETGSGHIVFDTSPELTTSFTTTGVFAINPGGALTIGDNGDTLYLNSSDWDISTTGDMTGIGAITMDGILDIEGAGLASGNWQFTTGTVEFDGVVSTSNNWTANNGVWNLAAVSSFTLGTSQLWNTSKTSEMFSSASWGFTTGNLSFDGTASTSGNWTINKGTWDFSSVGLLVNIGNAGTDFLSDGGLNIAGIFALGTDQLWTTSATGNVLSSHSWQFSTGQSVEFDGTASTSGNWTINSGVWDMGGATSLEIPNTTAPTVDANGEVAVDTTGGQFLFYSDEVNVLMATKSFAFNYSSGSFDLTNNQQYVQFHEPITITAIDCFVTSGTSAQIEIEECDANGANCATTDAAITCTTSDVADDGSLSNASIDALDWVLASISQGDVSGDVDSVHINVHFKYTAQ